MADQSLLGTLTGEHFQPVRLHYRVLNHPGLKRAFGKLRCLEYDAPRKRWVWLYAHEAKNLRFQRSYAQFPKELHPIVIGAFFLRTEETLLLDLRSCERALLAIPFFDTHLPRKLVALEHAEIVNQLFRHAPVRRACRNRESTLSRHQGEPATDPRRPLRSADRHQQRHRSRSLGATARREGRRYRGSERETQDDLRDPHIPRQGAAAADRTASRPLR